MTVPARITHLAELAGKSSRRIVGLMSGTSLDGLDIALCAFQGAGDATSHTLEHFTTRAYTADERARLRGVVFKEQVSLQELCVLNTWLAELHARHVVSALEAWGVPAADVDALASHGQTVYHAPSSWRMENEPLGMARHATLQLGDGDLLALRTGLLTLSDFRQKEIAGGGQGAPLAPYAETLLYHSNRPRILLNLGGIANFTFLPPRGSGESIRYGDTGPANTLIDGAARRVDPAGPGYDPAGAGAAKGKVHKMLLQRLKAHPFFALRLPKSTGPEMFDESFVSRALEGLGGKPVSTNDLLATLTRLTAETVADAIRREVPAFADGTLYVSGGGQHNRTLMAMLGACLPGLSIRDSADLGTPADAKEAVIFAALANEALAGPGFLATDGSGRRIVFGKISFPD